MPQKTVFKILGFDPGLTYCANTRAEFDITTGKLTILSRGKTEGKKSIARNKPLTTIYNSSLIQLSALREDIIALAKFKPDYVVTEDAFYQPGRLSAFVALVLCISTIEMCSKDYMFKPLYRIPPKRVKKLFTSSGDSDKLAIQDKVISHPNIIIKETKASPISNMTEHDADSIAVCYSFVTEVLPGLDLYDM